MDCNLGVLAFGDSITNGGGELQWGVALQSWALWVARGLGLPFTNYAADGARISDVLTHQIPLSERVTARPEGRYDLGCLYIGANDVRALDWDATEFERDLRAGLHFLAGRCDRVLTMTVPLDMGRPRARARVREANEAIGRVADQAGALLVDLRAFKARNHMMADRVHPTAFGQIAIAERALTALASAGLPTRVAPSSLIVYETTRLGRLRGDFTYVYRYLKGRMRTIWLRVRGAVGEKLRLC